MKKEKAKQLLSKISAAVIIIFLVVTGGGWAYSFFFSPAYINVFFYNKLVDKRLGTFMPCSELAVTPLQRKVKRFDANIDSAIKLLMEGKLTEAEMRHGFTSEFPNASFKYLGHFYDKDSVVLKFEDPKDFTSGGACRASLLRYQFEKTVKQFTKTKNIKFLPDTLFQP
ncbi:MAG: hypothetical protein WCJ46_03585 [bacterium]